MAFEFESDEAIQQVKAEAVIRQKMPDVSCNDRREIIAALSIAEGHWTRMGNLCPAFSDSRSRCFKRADDITETLKRLTT